MNGIGVIMPVENSMRNPQKLIGQPFILLMASGSLAALYFFSGFFGYLRFGDAIQGTITLNLPTDDWSAIAGQALIGIALFSNFGLMFFIPMEILFKLIHKKIDKFRNVSEIAIRTVIIILMVVVGIIIPDIGIFISLVGGFTSTCISFITPVTIETFSSKLTEGLDGFIGNCARIFYFWCLRLLRWSQRHFWVSKTLWKFIQIIDWAFQQILLKVRLWMNCN